MHTSRQSISSARYAAAALAAGVLIAGCGGSSHKATSTATSSSSPTAQNATLAPAFRNRANAVCSRSLAAFKKLPPFPYPTFDPIHPDVSKLPAIGRYFTRVSLPLFKSTEHALRALGQPARGQSAWQGFLSVEEANVTTFERQIAAAKRSDTAAFIATVRQLGGRQMSAAQGLGLPACGAV